MKTYQPSNKVTSTGLTWLLLSSIIGGAAIAGITSVISLLIYLIVLFPVGMGVAGGAVIATAIRQGKVRNPLIATLFGFFTGLIIYSSIHGINYWVFKQLVSDEISQELGEISDSQSHQLIDTFLQEESGAKGFWGFIKYNAKQGVSIGRVGSEGFNLGETGTWIYWVIEFGVINFIIAATAYSTAKNPFCENCNQWYGDKKRIGSVNPQFSQNFLNLLKTNQLNQAGKLIDPLQGFYAPSLDIHLQDCSLCRFSDLMLSVNNTSVDKKGNFQLKEVAQGMLSSGQYHQFHKAMTDTLAQDREPTAEIIHLAQQERSIFSAKDRFESHGLSASQEAKITQQLSRYPQVKEAYLIRKKLKYFPEKPFYLLGIIRRRGLIESEEADSNLLKLLMTELALPVHTWIMFLNKNKTTTQLFQKTAGKAFYSKK